MGKLPVMAAVRSADAFRRLHARDAIGALTLTAVSAILMSFGNAIHGLLLQALGMLGELAGGLMAMGALLRVAFADEHPGEAAFRPGPYGLQWRNTEWRLLGAGALVLLLCLLAALAATALAFAVLAGILLATGHGLTSQPMSDAGMIATGLGAVGGLYVAYRLILSMPATVSRQTCWERAI